MRINTLASLPLLSLVQGAAWNGGGSSSYGNGYSNGWGNGGGYQSQYPYCSRLQSSFSQWNSYTSLESSFCTDYLHISTQTSVVSTTVTPAPTTQTVTSTSSATVTTTSTQVVDSSFTSNVVVTSTTTSYCSVSGTPASAANQKRGYGYPNNPNYGKGCTWSSFDTWPSFPGATPLVSAACSCIGVTTPTTTVTQTSTAPRSTVTVTAVTVAYVTTTGAATTTVSQTVTQTSTVVATTTIPAGGSGTYTNSYGDTYEEYYNIDFTEGDLMSGTCYPGGSGFNVNGTLVPCSDFDSCQDVCSYANRNGYSCKGVSYPPSSSGGYTTCYLKSQDPPEGPNNYYCGEYSSASHPVDSAILLSSGSS